MRNSIHLNSFFQYLCQIHQELTKLFDVFWFNAACELAESLKNTYLDFNKEEKKDPFPFNGVMNVNYNRS